MQANTKSLRPLARWVVGAILSLAACAPSNAAGPAMLDVSYSSGIVALDAATRTLSYGSVSGNVTNVLTSGGSVYWQDGRNIYQARPNLFGAQLWYSAPEGFMPTDFTIAVPEPGTGWQLLAGGSALVWAALRRNRSRMKMSKVHGKEPEGLPTA